jgi:hypothetical protein
MCHVSVHGSAECRDHVSCVLHGSAEFCYYTYVSRVAACTMWSAGYLTMWRVSSRGSAERLGRVSDVIARVGGVQRSSVMCLCMCLLTAL